MPEPLDAKLLKALIESQKTIIVSLKAISSAPASSSSSASSCSLQEGLGDAFQQLLKQLRQSMTVLGLSFNPPITLEAAIKELSKISETIGQLISCVLLANSSSLLFEEWKSGVTDISQEVIRHIKVLEDQEDYLSSTGKVWESIDSVLTDLSRDEESALRRKWKSHQSTVKDAWTEFKEILESEGESRGDEDEDGDDQVDDGDGWDELDLGGEYLTEDERKRAEAAKPLLALHQILHSTLPKFTNQLSPNQYRPILRISSKFVDAYDDAVSSMHPGQDESEIQESLDEVEAISRQLASEFKDKSIDKWVERLDVEKQKWNERRMNLDSLKDAL
ncbi:uncharacterized protein I303_108419 [Kwoniella dejecticola CBS 10117]|uniref:Cyclin-D1-binding protein 1-like N-terminal domain-containing protein n=1 Tax=Kwoniella dejecticola CBS 10117 TaxID=1296121 RepID=A0A1A5ZXF6_9TREE|nr:uncharacterized protein I303_07255 [Kwoniella dejecticola CBS 10117]OBR82495.1 hypothetical protein I303_07255 [Kwoniella dejecticola CBS 10117]